MEFQLIREQAQNGRWVSQQARDARLKQIDADYQKAVHQLLRH
jgi:phosphonate transport system substrate-binding protein